MDYNDIDCRCCGSYKRGFKMKKKNSKKIIVFWINHITLTIILILIIFFANNALQFMGNHIIYCIIINGAVFSGMRVLNAWQKSNNYIWQLDENMVSENIKKNDNDNLSGITG